MTDLPHLDTLIGGMGDMRRRRLWQRDLAARLAGDAAWRDRAVALDRVLAGIDPAARQVLFGQVLGQVDQRDCRRGWGQAFDLLNQARAWRHLAGMGCREIRFLPGSMAQRSPDLGAWLGDEAVLCEVKTLHFAAPAVPQESVRRLRLRLADAALQLAATTAGRRIAYVCLDFPAADFTPAEMAVQGAALARSVAEERDGIEVVLDALQPPEIAAARMTGR